MGYKIVIAVIVIVSVLVLVGISESSFAFYKDKDGNKVGPLTLAEQHAILNPDRPRDTSSDGGVPRQNI